MGKAQELRLLNALLIIDYRDHIDLDLQAWWKTNVNRSTGGKRLAEYLLEYLVHGSEVAQACQEYADAGHNAEKRTHRNAESGSTLDIDPGSLGWY